MFDRHAKSGKKINIIKEIDFKYEELGEKIIDMIDD